MRLKAALFATVALLPGLASAQTYNRMISFGDSLTDNGNLFAVAGQPPAPYFAGRFSNGRTWAELLNGPMLAVGPTILGIGPNPGLLPGNANLNFAFGGSRTDTLVGPVPPGTAAQIGNYIALGGRFSRTDLVTLWTGANNLLQGIQGITNPATAAATMTVIANNAAGDAGAQVSAIARAGGGTVVTLNLPDLGAAPSFIAQGASAMQLASYASSTFNTAWAASTAAAAVANPNTNVIQIPVDQLFAAVIASPGAFGFSNVTNQCLTTASCVGGSAATQAGYLFWDGVHPTAQGHALLSNFISDYVFAGSRAAAMGLTADVGFWSRRQGMSDMMDRLYLAKPTDKFEYFVSGIGEHGERDLTMVRSGFVNTGNYTSTLSSSRYSAGGLRIGGFGQINPAWTLGMALSATVGDAKSGNVSMTPVSFGGDLVARWSSGPFFVNLGAGAQMNHYSDIERKSSLALFVNKSSTDGVSANAVAEAGYRYDIGSFGIVPKARIAYIWSQSAAMSETGLVAPVHYGARTVDGLAGGGEVRFEARMGDATAHALVGYEGFMTANAGRLNATLINNTAKPFSVLLPDPVSAGLLLGAGLDARFGSWKAGLNYRATIGEKSQVTHRGNVTVGMSF